MPPSSDHRLVPVLAGLSVACLVIGLGLMVRGLREHRVAGLAADSIAAVLDTTRTELRVAAGVLSATRDSFQLTRRRALQVAGERDALDRQLGDARAVTSALRLQIRALTVAVAGKTVALDSLDERRRVTLAVDSPPFHVAGEIDVPKPPAAAAVRLTVQLDPAPLRVRVGCGAASAAGVRPAEVAIAGPPWLRVDFPEPFQIAPDVCSPPRTLERVARLFHRGPFRSLLWSALGATAGGLAGVIVGGELRDAGVGAGVGAAVGMGASVAVP